MWGLNLDRRFPLPSAHSLGADLYKSGHIKDLYLTRGWTQLPGQVDLVFVIVAYHVLPRPCLHPCRSRGQEDPNGRKQMGTPHEFNIAFSDFFPPGQASLDCFLLGRLTCGD